MDQVKNEGRDVQLKDSSPTLMSGGGQTGNMLPRVAQPQPAAPHPTLRRLTPTECERLMGWPEGWTIAPSKEAKAEGERRDGEQAARWGWTVNPRES